MKQYQINKAYGALFKLSSMNLPMKLAYEIYSLKKIIKPYFDSEVKKESYLVAKFNGVIGESGIITFESDDINRRYRKELANILSVDVEIEYNPVVVSIDSVLNGLLSPDDIEALEGFVVFE